MYGIIYSIYPCTGVSDIITTFNDTVVIEGNSVTIKCETLGYPPPSIIWNKVNGILSDRISVSDSVSVPTGYGNVTRVSVNLTITNASREDTGVYTCSANNSIGSDSSNVSITVQCKLFVVLFQLLFNKLFSVAPEIILQLTDLLENETSDIQFVCRAIGVPVPYIRWYFNGVMINLSDSSKYNNSSMYLNESVIESTLNIINAKSSDVGRYTCEAENIIGSIRSSGVLTVNGMCCTCICIYGIIHTYVHV